jgi:hypothetical protein
MGTDRRRALLLLASLLLPARVSADYRRSYVDGRAALRRGRAEEAARLLAAAASERPTELARARLVGAIPEPYLPHHYLALALAKLDRCADALREWELSAAQGVITSLPALHAEANAGATACRQRLGIPSSEERADAAARQSHAALAQGLQAYLDGDHRQAVHLLDAMPTPAAPRARAWQLTVRAAARHALYRLGGERDAMLLAAALVDAREARRTEPTFQPNASIFPPSFLALYVTP